MYLFFLFCALMDEENMNDTGEKSDKQNIIHR